MTVFCLLYEKMLNAGMGNKFEFDKEIIMIPISDILIRSISGYVFMVPVFVLYFLWLKKLGRTQSFLHTAAVFVFGYYLFGLLTVTGIGFTSTMTFRPNISWTPFIGMITGPIDTILNIILFVPLGFFLPLLYKKYHHMKTVALTGFLFSLAVEIVQMFGWGSSDINDLMTNTAGACIGFLVYCLLSRILPANLKKQLQSSRVNAVAEVLLFAICTFAIMVTAQTYCRDISVKTRSALEVKRRSGDFVGAFTIYGYVKAGDKHKSLEVDEYAANVVRDIFRKRLEGFSASHIADELNRLGILSPLAYKRNHGMPHAKGGYTDRKDCKWSATTIIRILQDETYTGTLVQGKQTTPHFKLKEREDKPSSEWIRVEGTHEAIIQKHDFDLVQRLRRIDTRTSPKSDKVYLFSGILICGCCGCRMTRKTNRYKDKEYHYYYCPTGKKNGCTSSVMLKESDLIECVQDSLKGHIENVASLDALLSSISQERINRELAQEYAAQIRVNEKRVAQTEGFKAKLYENLVSGILTKEEFLSYKRKYNADIELFQKAIAEWNEKLTDVLENRSERNRWINHFMKFSTMEDIDRRAVMQLIRSIRVMGKDELHIEFNYQDEYQKAIFLAKQIATKNEERMVG